MTRRALDHARRRPHVAGLAGLAGAALLGLAFAGAELWRKDVVSAANRPEETDLCALGRFDAAAIRALIAGMKAEAESGPPRDCAELANERTCFVEDIERRIERHAAGIGHGMEGRIVAAHALMRARKAALLWQESPPPQARARSPSERIARNADGSTTILPAMTKPVAPRAAILTYALDVREVGLSGPDWLPEIQGRFSRTWDGRTALPKGRDAIAAVTIRLADPALRYPDDALAGATWERIDYAEAAWRAPGRETRASDLPLAPAAIGARLPAGVDSVHEIASLCPQRPGWLDVPAGGGG